MIYDLTQTITENLPVYPGDQKVRLEPVGGIDKAGFLDHILTMDTHNGTHIDAPAHMIDGGDELKSYPIERFVKKGICIDVSGGFNPEIINRSTIETNSAVLFYTGASDYFQEPRYWQDFPVMDAACADILMDKKVSIIGIDACGFDNQNDFQVHKTLLTADILLIENLTNLKDLIGKSFDLYALPIKLEKDGAPARVIAVISG